MIISDTQIEELIRKDKLGIEGYREENLTPNGYDLTISEVSIEGDDSVKGGTVKIPADIWFAVSTEEYVKFPSDIAGELWIRTTWARQGVISSFGMIDSGFEGNLTLSAYNSGDEIEIEIGETFAQLVFHLLSKDSEKLYDERSGNYQGSKGVTL
ncbi:MAG: dCTP deaminase [Thermoplasmatota archaeon]